ncbi:hypothetical protein BGX24_007721 [Mortierella sp. AD032]|nr:hypothetical protein BGX24_007721 [Mortierella sp. AD032]
MQAVRRINENGQAPSEAAASDIIHVACYPDPSLGKDIVLWDDIRAAFDDVMHIRSGTLDPLRIAAVPGATLDVVVRKPSRKQELSLESLKEALFGSQQESTLPNSTPVSSATATQTTTVEQIPTDDPVEATMKNSTKVDKPAAVITPPPPPYRGPHNQASSTTATERGLPGDGQLVAQPQEDVTPQKCDAPQEAVPQTRILTVVQKTAEVELKAKLGESDAQFTLGNMYDCGQGVEQCSSQALHWYRKAAEQGHAAAQFATGKGYQTGQIGRLDVYEAARWLLKASEQKNADAQNEIGVMISQCTLRPRYFECDPVASNWYRKAAEQGHAAAQYNLGDVYYTGKGQTKKDYSKAIEWYLKAAKQGHVSASNCAGNLYCIGYGIAQDYSKAAEWYLKAAEKGDSGAQNSLAVLYEAGLGVPEDKTKAIEWYQKAADGGNTAAQKAFGRLIQ